MKLYLSLQRINLLEFSCLPKTSMLCGSSTVMQQNKTYFDGATPFTLEIQVEQFNQFKSRTGKYFTQANKSSYIRHFSRPEDFAKAIFTLDIGQNDIADVISKVGKEDSQALTSKIVDYFSKQIQVSNTCNF